jgi:pimeloyl-ACP methyl ester carboxylesterase
LEQAEFLHLTPEKKASALIGLAFNKPFYRFTFGFLAGVQTRFIGASGRVGIAGQSEACLKHDTLERLSSIAAPTLVIVGTGDRIIKPVSSEVIAGRIPYNLIDRYPWDSPQIRLDM